MKIPDAGAFRRHIQCLHKVAIMDKIGETDFGSDAMKTMSAKDAKNAFGSLLDTARAEPVTIEKHGRPVVVVLSVEEYQRLHGGAAAKKQGRPQRSKKGGNQQ